MRERGNPILHFLDRYVGIPVIAVLGHLKRKQLLPPKIETIGLLRTAAIGDTVLLSAAIADLRRAFPRTSLIFFAGPSNYEIARMLDGLNGVVKVPISNLIQGVRAVRSVPVDIMLDFGQWPRLDALLTLLSRATFTIGFRTPGQYRHFGYDLEVEHCSQVHEIQNFRQLVRALGIETENVPSLRVPRSKMALSRDYAVFHLWPGGRRRDLKRWPSERWLQLMDEFARWGIEVVLTGVPSDFDANRDLISRASAATRSFLRNAAGLSLQETGETLAGSCLVVSVDTGVMHMAAALGVPLVALHGPTSGKRWGPVSKRAIIIEAPVPECGYISLGWENISPAPACMECIQYEEVRKACQTLLGKGSEHLRVERPIVLPEPIENKMGH